TDKILAPLPHVAMHVVQSQFVRRIRAHFRRPTQGWPLLAIAEWMLTVEIRLLRGQVVGRFVEVEVVRTLFLRSGPSSTSVFPLRLTRQAVQIATSLFFCVQLLDELLRVIPGYRLHWELLQILILDVLDLLLPSAVTGEPARVLAHHFLPLALCHRVD